MTRLFVRSVFFGGVLGLVGCSSSPGTVGAGSGSGGTSGSGSGGSAVVDAGGTGGVGGSGSGSGGTVAPVDSSAGMETAGETSGAGGGLPDVTSDGDGDRIIGPTFTQDPLVTRQAGVPASRSFKFTMALAQSKYYTGAGQQNAVTNRSISVSVPMQYDPTKPAALLVTQDAQESGYLPAVIDNLIAMKQVPVIVSMYIANGGGDSVGNERGLEYDTVSGLYAEFVIKEVVPEAIAQAKTQLSIDLKITDNPNGHATLGGSSGGAAAFSMIWWHPDLFRLMIGFSPTLVSQVPKSSPFPNGCWVYHDLDPYDPTAPNGLVMHNCEAAGGFVGDSKPGACDTPLTQATCTAVSGCVWNTMNNRPIRVWHQSSQNDLDSGENEPATDHRNFDLANRRTAAELKARGYHYHYDHADGGNHNDDRVQRQTIVEAMKWLWRGYPID